MMQEAIKNFSKQFEYEPRIENETNLKKANSFVVVGMGGSHLAADLIKTINPSINLTIHKNYGLPASKDGELIILSSYSGNTEEVLSAFDEARSSNLNMAVIAMGGQLIEKAKAGNVPYVQLPDTGIQPRMALGFSIRALFKLMDMNDELNGSKEVSKSLKPEMLEESGRKLSTELRDRVPIIYASSQNESIAYSWKIKFNETGKIPAFYNVLPELNHNEMTGFDVKDSTKHLSLGYYFIFLSDKKDHPKIQTRMDVLKRMYEDRELRVKTIYLEGDNKFHKIFSSLVIADWTSFHTAQLYGIESEQVPMVEEFKKLI